MRYALLVLLSMFSLHVQAAEPERWAVYYGSALKAEDFASLDLVVFDADHHPPIQPLKEQGKTVLGYLSLGEAESYRDYYLALKKGHMLIKPSLQWKDHRVIDLRRREWGHMVVNTLVPQILAKGFDGIMLDTVDSPLHLENESPMKYAGMKESAMHIICAIRTHYPNIKIMLNRGFEILPDVANCIDMSLAESTLADTHPRTKRTKRLADKEHMAYVQKINDARATAPALKIYTLDYWNMNDRKGVTALYATQRGHGFIPYVSTLDLQKVFPEPR